MDERERNGGFAARVEVIGQLAGSFACVQLAAEEVEELLAAYGGAFGKRRLGEPGDEKRGSDDALDPAVGVNGEQRGRAAAFACQREPSAAAPS